MNKLYFLLILLLSVSAYTCNGQSIWRFNFDPPYGNYYDNQIVFDTIKNHNNKWQIGSPHKTVFNSAYSSPNVIVTDTINPVPANDTSIFYIKHFRDNSVPMHFFALHFKFQMDAQPNDQAIVEISPDTGHTWINPLTQDSIFKFGWQSDKPTLTGYGAGWQAFDLEMAQWASAQSQDSFPIYITADTVLFRFTYITDSSSTLHDGWMMDDFEVEDWWEGVNDIRNDNLISIYPNPSAEHLFIKNTSKSDKVLLQICDYTGRIITENPDFRSESYNTRELTNGMYMLRYSNSKYYSVKKFIVLH